MSFLSSLGLSTLGTAVNTLAGNWSAKQNASLSKDTWRYQQQNAHQFEVQDLRAAGLNPILSATNSQIAGMSSVSSPSVSDNGVFSSMAQAASAKELKKMDLENELLKTKVDAAKNGVIVKDDGSIERTAADKRFGAETANIESDTNLKDITAGYTSSKQVNEKNFINAQIDQIRNQMANENRLTDAQISRIESQKAVDMATIHTLAAQAKQAISQSSLLDKEKESIQADLDSYVTKLANLSAKQRYDMLLGGIERGDNATGYLNEFGFVMDLLNPFQSFGTSAGKIRFGSHK